MSIIETLTEGIVNRDMAKEGQALLDKWTATGLLEGLDNEHAKHSMARLLENQAKEVLRESSTMAAGDVHGFAAVAFPIVRRVFAGLIANDLVSVQPMSLPSGLIFFLDFTFGAHAGGRAMTDKQGLKDNSIYGQGVKGAEIIEGVSLNNVTQDEQPYGMMGAWASATGSVTDVSEQAVAAYLDGSTPTAGYLNGSVALSVALASSEGDKIRALLKFDPDVLDSAWAAANSVQFVEIELGDLPNLSSQKGAYEKIDLSNPDNAAYLLGSGAGATPLRRLRQLSYAGTHIICPFYKSGAGTLNKTLGTDEGHANYPISDGLEAVAESIGSVKGGDYWGLEGNPEIPEIDIQVDSTAITAQTKKLKAKWTPELGQDLNAYHNLDAEVELTSILSEQIALEIDREILSDLISGAKAGTYYWSRAPGLFVDRVSGAELGAASAAPDFTGTVSEWYETLIETMNDVSAQIHRKTLRGGANFVVTSPEVANILEFTSGFRANVTADADKGMIGAMKAGSLSRKWDVIVDPYFPRNLVLMGRKGSSFLESGYVYAPYVPLQTTPTIFGPEDFVPRKGVMTRYGKKMVRPDMYGLVIVRGLLGEEGDS